MDARHTALPWEWWTSNSRMRLTGADGKDGGVISASIAADGLPVVNVSQANAEFIVRACNSFDDLAKTLKGLLDCAGEEISNASDEALLDGVGNGPDDLTKEQAQAFLNARAALAKAAK